MKNKKETESLKIKPFPGREVCIGGVGKMFYEGGFPIGMCVKMLSDKGIQTSFYHLIDELWNNGWSWETIEMKLRGEVADDVDGALNIDFNDLERFYNLLEQPKRSNGGYEESREMLFQFLYGMPSTAAIENMNKSK